MVVKRTTHGSAALRDGYVTISFGVLDENNNVSDIELDVDAYAIILARDILTAISEQSTEEVF